ncbi:hypothetical protein Tco_1108130 [Tanacetum coccineum]
MENEEQNPPQQDQPFVAAKQVSFNLEDIILNTNNEVALLYPEHNNNDFFKCVFDFISKCCIRNPFTRSPIMYKEYLAEFWYSAKALDNSKVSFSIPTGGIYGEVKVNTFRNAIGAHYLPHSSEYVAPPSIDVVRHWFPTIGYGEEVSAKGTLKKSLLPPRQKPGAQPGHKKNLTSSKQPFVSRKEAIKDGSSKAPIGSKIGHSKKRKESSSAMDSNPSQPPVSIHVDTGMHKEDQQATGDPTSLGVTSEERANPQRSSGMSALNLNKSIFSTLFIDHSEFASGCDASADSSVEADPGLSTPNTLYLNNKSQNHKLELKKNKAKAEAEAALLKAQPSFPYTVQLNELLVKSLQTEFSKILFAYDFSSSLPTELKDLSSKFNELTKEVKGLKKQVHELEVDQLGELKEIPTKL